MAGRIKWIERTFSFDFPTDYYPEILERLRGTPPRAEALIKNMPAAILTVKPEEQWSIQEHVGHLIHTETLLAARLDDYDAGADTLTPPGIPGKKSEQSRHNEKPIKTILENLRQAREMQIKRLEALQPEDFGRTAFHPRLKVPMRLVDTMYFFAEHDDYHLARARETALALIG